MTKVEINYDICTTAKECLNNCPVGVFEEQDGKVVVAHPEQCTVCRVCESVCPCGAVTVTEE